MTEILKRASKFVLCAALVLHAAACGTILHPERKGQTQGNLDVGVVVLDAIGLLFFIIPGVIAFAVDFSNGTIYLPGGSPKHKSKAFHFDPKGPRAAQLEKILSRETGRKIELSGAEAFVTRLDSSAQLPAYFARAAAPSGTLTARR